MSLPPSRTAAPRCSTAPVPVVFIDVHSARSRGCRASLGDDVAGGRLAARHLLELGHRDIGFIGDVSENPFGFTSSRDRQRGRRAELARRRRRACGPSGSGLARTAATRRATWRARMLTRDDRPDGDLRRQRHAGARRHRRGPRAGPPRSGRPVGDRLRRHRGRRLRRADDRPPAALRVGPRGAPSCSSPRSAAASDGAAASSS